MKKLKALTIIVLITSSILLSCKDNEPSGPEGALGKQFNLAIDKITSSLAYSILTSSDGTNILVTTNSTNGGFYQSTDGGTTFTQIDNIYLANARGIDNQGNILLNDNRTFKNGTMTSVNSYDILILGDNGKIFSYNQNTGTVRYKDITSGDFITSTLPTTPTPGSGASTYYALKAPGKGLLFIDVKGTDVRTVNAYLLNEATLQWSTHTLTFNTSGINDCNGLSRFERFAYVTDNTVTVKGCTGTALLNLANSNTTYLTYPDVENVIDTDLRDGAIYVDSKKQVYLVIGTYDDLTRKYIYRYNGSQWSQLEGFVAMNTVVFTSDQAGNIYFNTSDGAGESVRGAVKLNVDTDTKTALGLPTENLLISDAASIGNDHMLTIVEGKLYDHDLIAASKTAFDLETVTHINILSDGRWLAGGVNCVYISSDEGKNWTETKNIFSVHDANEGSMMAVHRSRILNGKIILNGVYKYFYDNLSLGIKQDKYNNIAVELDGSTTTKLPYQFPTDFLASTIGPDATVYGTALFVSEFGTVIDPYELKQNVTGERLKEFSVLPQVITEEGLQLAIKGVTSGTGTEVVSRNSSSEEWQSTNTSLPVNTNGGLRLSGEKLVYVTTTEVYLSGN